MDLENTSAQTLNETAMEEELVIIEEEEFEDSKFSQTLDEIELDLLTKKVELMK